MRIWDEERLSPEDQGFWERARDQLPDCPIFKRLVLSEDDQEAQEEVFAEVAEFFSRADGVELGDDGKTFRLRYDVTSERE
jgi:hypothetical protein